MQRLIDKLMAAVGEGPVDPFRSGVDFSAGVIEAYRFLCAPRTTPPTLDEFQRHAAIHGRDVDTVMGIERVGYLRIQNRQKLWNQCGAAIRNGKVMMISIAFIPVDIVTPWQWSDEAGNAIPGPDWK